ncbi:HD domain-containing protein [Nocardia beijingensis]|uniref:HD domain-containing protein n=1 Tax=Nocardia beijingensis TaxID=95162 RepID=UPI0018948AEA|nr:HD domain-containing protein [Nocardia beijingensis]MBF6467040.1 HD domain-containing protein [Nocardia beijingensis]
MASLGEWAEGLARTQLASSLPRRWAHVQGVARQAQRAASVVDDADELVAAAWLHDIGYAPDLVRTGFHPVDGARFLRDHGVAERLCALVANHSCACVEARRRGIPLDWPDEQTPLRDALWWADMTTTPDGLLTTAQDRIGEVCVRYGEEHVVSLSLQEAAPQLLAAVARTEDRLSVSSAM